MQTVYRKLTELKKLPNNPRIINDQQFKTLCKSIKDNPDYFEARPIILSNRTGELVIIAGNQRYEAAKSIGLKEAPTFLIEGLTEERENEIIIRDNVQNGSFDWNILANEWDTAQLEEWGMDVVFAGSELNKMSEDDLDMNEEFDPIGLSKGFQRVVFIFNSSDDAESYLKRLGVKYKKMNMAWQVNMNTQSI